MNISILVATRKRPKLLKRMFESAINTAKYSDKIEMSVYIDRDDEETLEYLKTLNDNVRVIIGDRIIMSDMWNKAYERATADILMGCADDLIFRSKDWDEKVINTFSQYEDKIVLVYPDDLIQRSRLATHLFLHRRWVETLGYFSPPYFSCDYADTWLDELANTIGRRIFLPDVIIEHMHFTVGKGEIDDTHKERMARCTRDNTGRLYSQLAYKRQIDIQRLRNAIKYYGSK